MGTHWPYKLAIKGKHEHDQIWNDQLIIKKNDRKCDGWSIVRSKKMQKVLFLQLPKSEDLLDWKPILIAVNNNLWNFVGVSPAQLTVAAGILLRPRSDPPLLYEPSLERGRGQGPRCETLFFHQGQRWHETRAEVSPLCHTVASQDRRGYALRETFLYWETVEAAKSAAAASSRHPAAYFKIKSERTSGWDRD